ncbi:hypothetical protein [Sphingorhabdus sp.]|uniref:hypothetical protein n=1 Tax=Sphingorhabdus sp. TaxID=1902408 RepID=UPI0035939E0F
MSEGRAVQAIAETRDGAGIESLDELNSRLAGHFAALRASRGGAAVYGLEHNLDARQLLTVFDLVGREARRQGISVTWMQRPLPLIVAASEIGYDYRGTGTDFWPRFESAIGASLGSSDREQHSKVFEYAHRSFGIKKPVSSPWTKAFRHIAWPIANAVAPREVHRPLATSLREILRTSGAARIVGDLVADMAISASSSGSGRFADWVTDTGLASAVVLHLLDLPDPEQRLSQSAAARILSDLETDPTARRAIKNARRLHRERPVVRRQSAAMAGTTAFFIREADGEAGLWLRMPALTDTTRGELRTILSRSGTRLRLWQSGAPIEMDTLLSGLPVSLVGIDVAAAFADQLPFLTSGLASSDVLAELSPRWNDPVVFVRTTHSGDFEQYFGEIVPGSGPVRVLTRRSIPTSPSSRSLPPLAGFQCFEVDAASAAGQELLTRLGRKVSPTGIEVFGGGRISDGLLGPVFATGLPVLLRPSPAPAASEMVSFRLDAEEAIALSGHHPVAVLYPSSGEHAVEVRRGASVSTVRFSVADPDSGFEPLAVIAEPSAPTLDDFIRQQIALRITAPVVTTGVPYHASLVGPAGLIASARGVLPRLPAMLSAMDPVLATLRSQLLESPPGREAPVELVFGIGEQWSQRWRLFWEPAQVEWQDVDGAWQAFGDGNALELLIADAGQPLTPRPAVAEYRPTEDTVLLIPVVDGIAQLAAAYCVAPSVAPLVASVELPRRILRQRFPVGDGAGLVAVIDGYLGWTLARPSNVIAAMKSRLVSHALEKMLVMQLCGERWASAEERAPLLSGDAWDCLARVAIGSGLAAGGTLPEIGPREYRLLEPLLAAAMKLAVPDLWESTEEPDPDSFAESMDMAVIDAYEEFGRDYANGTDAFDDVDTSGAPEAWLRTLRDTVERRSGTALVKLVLPPKRALALQVADYSELVPQEVISLLDHHHFDLIRSGARWLSIIDLRAGFLLWTNPAQLLRCEGWPASIARFLEDRQTSRAIRYAALRFRASRNISDGFPEL